jgi:hypothetical protein
MNYILTAYEGNINEIIRMTNLYKTDKNYSPVNYYNFNEGFIGACQYGHYKIVVYSTQLYKFDNNYKIINLNEKYYCYYIYKNEYYKILKYLFYLYFYDTNYKPIYLDLHYLACIMRKGNIINKFLFKLYRKHKAYQYYSFIYMKLWIGL